MSREDKPEGGAKGASSQGSAKGKPGAPEGESSSGAEETVRTRSLFEPASPAKGGKRPEPPDGQSKGATPRDSGPKAENGRTAPGGKPDSGGKKDREPAEKGDAAEAKRARTVKVIVGTRRHHTVDCPLIKGAVGVDVETMTLSQAEDAGLTACSVCQLDRQTVG